VTPKGDQIPGDKVDLIRVDTHCVGMWSVDQVESSYNSFTGFTESVPLQHR